MVTTIKEPIKGEIEFDCVKIMNNGTGMAHGVSVVFYKAGAEMLRLPLVGVRLKGMPCIEIENLRAYLPYIIQ